MKFHASFKHLNHLLHKQGERLHDALNSRLALKARAGTRKTIKVMGRLYSQINTKATGPLEKSLQWAAFSNTLMEELMPDPYNSFFKKHDLAKSYQDMIGSILMDKYIHSEDAKCEEITFEYQDSYYNKKLFIIHIEEGLLVFPYVRNWSGGQEYRSTDPWYHSKSLDINLLLDMTWETDYLHLEFGDWEKKSKGEVAKLTPRKKNSDPLNGKKNMEQFHELTNIFKREPTGTILIGPPGTGKSRTVAYAAESIHKRLLSVRADHGCHHPTEVVELFKVLKPDILFLDDIDHVGQKGLFQLVDALRKLDLHLVIAVNKPEIIDEALWRPERIDHLFKYDLPDEEDRRLILNAYGKHFDVKVPMHFAEKSEGLSGAFLREMVRRLKFQEPDRILEQIIYLGKMKELAKPEEKKKEEIK